MSIGMQIFLAPINIGGGSDGPSANEFQMYDEGVLVSVSVYHDGTEETLEVVNQ